jgi:acyl carrier protein
LGEVEAALSAHPAVRDAVVVAGEDAGGERRLFGYLVANEGAAAPSSGELVDFLQKQLPDYMIPAGFMALDELPLTPSGKVDRRALPAPDRIRADSRHEFVAPRTPIEEMLAEIWRKMLNLEQVGVYDGFFELGGHSLLATQLVSRMRETFNVELPLKVFFEGAPTIARLAAAVEEIQLQQSNEEAIAAMLMEMDDLSDEEIKALLREESMLPHGEQGE